MHFLLAYNVDTSSPSCSVIHSSIIGVLKPYDKANLFGDTYIIKLEKIDDWEKIRKGLTDITELNGCDCKFIMTPVVKGGYYNGWLDKDTWPIIDKIIN